MTGFDQAQHPREGDGKFAAKHLREDGDVHLDDQSVPLADVVPASGTLTIGEDDFDDFYSFTEIDVTRNADDTFAVQASGYTDVQYGLVRAHVAERGWSIDDADDVTLADREVNAWLARNSEDAIAWFEHETGARIHREFEWDHQRFSWGTELPADSSTDQVIAAADEASDTHPDEADDLYARMWHEAEGFTARRGATA